MNIKLFVLIFFIPVITFPMQVEKKEQEDLLHDLKTKKDVQLRYFLVAKKKIIKKLTRAQLKKIVVDKEFINFRNNFNRYKDKKNIFKHLPLEHLKYFSNCFGENNDITEIIESKEKNLTEESVNLKSKENETVDR